MFAQESGYASVILYQTSEDVAVMENSCGVEDRGGEGWYVALWQCLKGGINAIDLLGKQPCRSDRGNQAPPIMKRGSGGNIIGQTGMTFVGLPNFTRDVILPRAELNQRGWAVEGYDFPSHRGGQEEVNVFITPLHREELEPPWGSIRDKLKPPTEPGVSMDLCDGVRETAGE